MGRMKRMKSESYSSEAAVEIPEDLWIETLARVPSNLVLKFRGLSKFHRDLINSPNFIKKHSDLSHKTSSSCSYVLLSSFMKDYWVKELDLTNSDAIELHRLIPPRGNDDYECEGCCKGILLLRSHECIVLWNPLTGASRSFPHARRRCEDTSYFLGQDEVTADLKILKIVHRYFPNCERPADVEIECEIYSSESDIWRKAIKSKRGLKLHRIEHHSGAAFVEGTNSVHMVATVESETRRNQIVVAAFDFSAGRFNRMFHLPPGAWGDVYVSSLDGCLCVYTPPLIWTYDGVLKVWMMKEYGVMESWELQMNICIQTDSPVHLMQLDFANDGRQTLVISRSGVQFYDLEEKKLKNEVCFADQSMFTFETLNRCFLYTPSLRRV